MMKTFFSKLLLFGEYGLMFGAKALAVPFHDYHGRLVKSETDLSDQESKRSSKELASFSSWFRQEQWNFKMNFQLNLEKLEKDISENIFFQSNIPYQYGVGSSGALCAALFHEYSVYGRNLGSVVSKKHSLPSALQHDFAIMESYFHGKSSGIDPLVSFISQPVLIENKDISLPYVNTEQLPAAVYLVDTGLRGATSPLVGMFLEKMKDRVFAAVFREQYIPENDEAIHAFLNRQPGKFFQHLKQITLFQLDIFNEMIPGVFAKTMQQLMSKGIYTKLLGSGGGGFLLAFAPVEINTSSMPNLRRIF